MEWQGRHLLNERWPFSTSCAAAFCNIAAVMVTAIKAAAAKNIRVMFLVLFARCAAEVKARREGATAVFKPSRRGVSIAPTERQSHLHASSVMFSCAATGQIGSCAPRSAFALSSRYNGARKRLESTMALIMPQSDAAVLGRRAEIVAALKRIVP